ncbi:MAG: GreA/GreB family elongation factor [Rickettsiales bacterium]|jgi:hypothetical protein|nr:GreA/GreB family elongation factor [Rickettsiales bacterium]
MKEDNAIFVTREFFETQLEKLRRLDAAIAELSAEKVAACNGDTNGWHDNFAYEETCRLEWQAKSERNSLAAEIAAYRAIGPAAGDPIKAALWTIVEATNENGASREIGIAPLGGENMSKNIYSYRAPIADALLGAALGDVREIKIPSGTISLTITGLRRLTNPAV